MERTQLSVNDKGIVLTLTNEDGTIYKVVKYPYVLDALSFYNDIVGNITAYDHFFINTIFSPVEDSFILIFSYNREIDSFVLDSYYYGPNKWCKMMCKIFNRCSNESIYTHYRKAMNIINHDKQSRIVKLKLEHNNTVYELCNDYGIMIIKPP